jgi:Spy/CpxP family protein refolding chaperone
MKKRIAIAAGILMLAALAAVPIVYAQGHGMGFRHHGGPGGEMGMLGGGRHLEHMAQELNLSEQQVDQIKAIFADLHQQNSQYRESMHGGMKAVMETLLKNPNDTATAQALIDQQAATEKQLKTNMLLATSKALNVLTPDQRAQLAQKIEEHSARFERRSK